MSLSLLHQHCSACLVRLIWMVLENDGNWPYSCCFVRCWLQDFMGKHVGSFYSSHLAFFFVFCEHPCGANMGSTDTSIV